MTNLPVTMESDRYLGWDAWRIQRGSLELVLVPQVGGRIVRLACEGEDLIFTLPEFHGRVESVATVGDVHTAKQEMGFRLWGGEKTWLAPQTHWTDGVPFLDLDSGQYALNVLSQTSECAQLRMTSPVCRETGMRIVRTITVRAECDGFDIVHALHNTSTESAEWGLWSVSQLLKPAYVYLPRRSTSSHPEGVKTFVEEGESAQVRPHAVQEIGKLARITCHRNTAFKFGVDATEGWLLAVCKRPGAGAIGYLTTYAVASDQPYAHGCSAEVYNSDRLPYFEAEVHSPLRLLAPGRHTTFRERRRLFPLSTLPQTEMEVRALMED